MLTIDTGISIALLLVAVPLLWKAFQIKSRVDTLIARDGNDWTINNMNLWAERLKNKNPTLHVPSVSATVEDGRRTPVR